MLEVYTDGACKGNPGPGGAGVVIVEGGKIVREVSEFLGKNCTNNIAELVAIGFGLHWAYIRSTKTDVTIYTDSKYAIGVLTGEYKAKKNLDTIRKTKQMMDIHESVKFVHIKGHSGNEYNELADKLAQQGCYSR